LNINTTLKSIYDLSSFYVMQFIERWGFAMQLSIIIIASVIFILFLKRLYIRSKIIYHKKVAVKSSEQMCIEDLESRIRTFAESEMVYNKTPVLDIVETMNRHNYKELKKFRKDLSLMPGKIIALVPSARWLFDNYYLLYKELKTVIKTGVSKNKKDFPLISKGPLKGYYRIHALSLELTACTSKFFDSDSLKELIQTYQEEKKLTSAEIWAFSNIIKGSIIESVLYEAKAILENIKEKMKADDLMDSLISRARNEDSSLMELMREGITPEQMGSCSFMSHIIYRLKEISADETQVVKWLNECIEDVDLERDNIINELVHRETSIEAVYMNRIRSLILSLKEISDMNWEDFFEEVSVLDYYLRRDPAKIYTGMDFYSRDKYRHEIEKIAKKLKVSEKRVAKSVLYIAVNESDKSRRAHIGDIIFGEKKEKLYESIQNKRKFSYKRSEKLKKVKGILYFASLISLSGLMVAGLVYLANYFSPNIESWKTIVLAVISLIPVTGISIEIVNKIMTSIIPPAPVLSMDFSEGIPKSHRTIVAMPVLLENEKQIEDYTQKMERYYLGNKHENLYFAILGDFSDATERQIPEDEKIIGYAKQCIEKLNEKYPSESMRFSLFIRYRKYNDSQGCWMGWERKRGKLEEFNELILGSENTSYEVMVCDKKILKSFRYVITLDADTELIRESAHRLVGVMAHPINRPVLNREKTKIVRGYSIVQSEIRNRLSSAKHSAFSSIFADSPGIDTYSTAVSDIYHDTFNQGIFYGKGIYNVKMFNRLTNGEIPENAVLSHDLLESCYAGCTFASSIKLMDKFPSGLMSYIKREHRWIRGDWQLIPWLFKKSALGGLSRWKLFDNMRRSLMQINWLLLIFFTLYLLPELFWAALLIIFSSTVINIISSTKILFEKLKNPESSLCFKNIFSGILKSTIQGLLIFILIPLRAFTAADAILRTMFRLFISHKNMLEWATAENIEKSTSNTFLNNIKLMVSTSVAGMILLPALLVSSNLLHLIIISVLCFLWITSPIITYIINYPVSKIKKSKFEQADIILLRKHARKIWSFVEDFQNEKNNWLCPDNLQIIPEKRATQKTSPTNIGLQLMTVLTAKDMGYIGISKFVDICEKILLTVDKMEKWEGHLFNWYNTKTLDTLQPRYISTVDSGNYLGYLITLNNGMKDFLKSPAWKKNPLEGINDTLILSGIDYKIQTDSKDANQVKEILEKIIGLTHGQRKSWENENWTNRLENDCREILEEMNLIPLEDSNQGKTIMEMAEKGNDKCIDIVARINELSKKVEKIVEETNFRILYDRKHHLFVTGFNADHQTFDGSKYDLLASEARQASFIAIAKGDVPQKHWFKLGRPLTIVNHIQSLVSWSGSMFEYLMPDLIMKNYTNSVIRQSCHAMVISQMKFAKKNNMPWGISESQYYRFDTDSNFQYKAFGVTDLSFQSSMEKEIVVSPYSTMLAINILPKEALDNIRDLEEKGMESEYGFYESMDYSVPDTSSFKRYSIVKSYMMHHQGMSMVSINNAVNNKIMKERFHAEPIVKATEIILEEYSPMQLFNLDNKEYNLKISPQIFPDRKIEKRYFTSPVTDYPCTHVLCNDQYLVMMTTGGTGFSKCNDIYINRWRGDHVNDLYGTFFYIKNIETKEVWSSTYYPMIKKPDKYEVIFDMEKVEYIRKDSKIKTHSKITISPLDNVEIRSITLGNEGSEQSNIEITSYIEIVNDSFESDISHPAFSKLFNEVIYLDDMKMLVGKRRPRSEKESERYIVHFVTGNTDMNGGIEYETDRTKFIGRGKSLLNPDAINTNLSLSGKDGQMTDPILSIRVTTPVKAGSTSKISFVTGYCNTWQEVLDLHHKYSMAYRLEEIFELSKVNSELEMIYLDITSFQVNMIQDIIGLLYYPSNLLRADGEIIKLNNKDQRSLWRFGISGDNPILLLRISDVKDVRVAKSILTAYEFFKKNRIKADIVILNEEKAGYSNELNKLLSDMTSKLRMYDDQVQKRNLFIIQSDSISKEEIDLLSTVSRVIIDGETGFYNAIDKKLSKIGISTKLTDEKSGANPFHSSLSTEEEKTKGTKRPVSEFNNYLGGFLKNGREYEIYLTEGQRTPKPWSNVIANEGFGFNITESGSGYTWFDNSRENKLTSWSNDPVTDPPSEAVYIIDEKTGEFGSIACSPINDKGAYTVLHGHGYSVFRHEKMQLKQDMTIFAAKDDPVKIWHIELDNTSDSKREISLVLYVEWVLGVSRDKTSPYLVTKMNKNENVITVKNVYDLNYSNLPAFVSSSEKIVTYTCDRSEFIGVGSSLSSPVALVNNKMGETSGAGYDPCSAIKITVNIEPGQTKQVVFVMGQTDSDEKVTEFVKKYCDTAYSENELDSVKSSWKEILGQIKIKTPDRALDILVNEWLLYQVIACRLRSRSAFYQCGGAYGFRDQLQDVLALMHSDTKTVRKQILLCSTRQFPEGDVQHWWHNHTGQGVRTKISDDLLWLPYVTAHYVKSTGDIKIVDEKTDYITGPLLKDNEAEIYIVPEKAENPQSLYKHCIKAIEKSLETGANGLPLMGAGDWNDGMNRVGIKGKGESVWLGWFLSYVLKEFSYICEMKNDMRRAEKYRGIADKLLENTEKNAWDGNWYLRAFYDNGTPLGSGMNDECKIDSISQSWSVLSGGGDKERAKTAMESAYRHLVKEEDGVICLFTPPFDKTANDPGYIKGYYPGVRENGGQYTHAAIWMIMANLRLGHGDTAERLFAMINPVHMTSSFKGAMKYQQEPYVLTADVYSREPLGGRGGWSWYTGSAGWMYQAIVTEMLGIKKENDRLIIDPVISSEWSEFSVEYNYMDTKYIINVENPNRSNRGYDFLHLDKNRIEGNSIQLVNDGQNHTVEIVL